MSHTILELQNITKSFGGPQVLQGICLTVAAGEFITLLGASGCGKTTTLRIIAGLEEPDSGAVLLEGVDVTHFEPNQRNVNTVFQNYALFPHMSVGENVAYGQKLRKVPKQIIQQKVHQALELVQLEGYENRMPQQLSGGQRQRVAIARAVINEPKVLLLDEPLGALDLQLRHQMQVELKRIQKQVGITFIYITHDQEEALNMSDRVIVMRNGQFEQVGDPITIYENPKTSYVASFVGAANILTADLVGNKQGNICFTNENGTGYVQLRPGQVIPLKRVTVAVRGEYVTLVTEPKPHMPAFGGVVTAKNFVGGSIHLEITMHNGETMTSYYPGIHCPTQVGEAVFATWDSHHAVLVDCEVEHEA